MKPLGRELIVLGGNIRRRRRALNLSQDELAFRCGLHRTYITGIEQGARNLSFNSLLALANGLEVTISDLMVGVQTSPEAAMADIPFQFQKPRVNTAAF